MGTRGWTLGGRPSPLCDYLFALLHSKPLHSNTCKLRNLVVSSSSSSSMASFHLFWVLTLLLVTVLRASPVASPSRSYDGSQVSDDLGSLPAARKLLDSTSVGKISELNGGSWCVAQDGAQDSQLKSSIDYACSHGADCKPIQSGGDCYEPNTMKSHASFAMNSYFQSNGRAAKSCDFSGTATITNKDPSYGKCKYPS